MKDQINFLELARKYEDKLRPIKVFLTDVDGILTDGKIYFAGDEVGFNRFFHVHDGYGFKLLQAAGIKVGIISGGASLGLEKRFSTLKVEYCFIGNEDKREAYLKIKEDGFKDSEILYMGDELFDLPILKRAGFCATVPSACLEVQEVVDYTTFRESGQGCVREVIDIVRFAQNIVSFVPDFDEL